MRLVTGSPMRRSSEELCNYDPGIINLLSAKAAQRYLEYLSLSKDEQEECVERELSKTLED
jgi:hypothetical protein